MAHGFSCCNVVAKFQHEKSCSDYKPDEQAEQITKWKDAFDEMSECYGNAVKKDFKQAEQITALLESDARQCKLFDELQAENQRLKEKLTQIGVRFSIMKEIGEFLKSESGFGTKLAEDRATIKYLQNQIADRWVDIKGQAEQIRKLQLLIVRMVSRRNKLQSDLQRAKYDTECMKNAVESANKAFEDRTTEILTQDETIKRLKEDLETTACVISLMDSRDKDDWDEHMRRHIRSAVNVACRVAEQKRKAAQPQKGE